MILWIARDKDGRLYLFTHKPERRDTLGGTWSGEFWDSPDLKTCEEENEGYGFLELDQELYPDITWESEPRMIKI